MSRTGKLGITAVVVALAIAGLWWLIAGFFLTSPGVVDFASGHQPGKPVNMTIQTVGSVGSGDHPTWVSYLVRDPSGNWEHTTLWQLPAHTRINVTVYQYDSGGPLRNQAFGRVTGTLGGLMFVNGKPVKLIDSNSSTGNGVAHTFDVPTLGINVPLYANNANATLCAAAPCQPNRKQNAFNVIKFSFETPGPGNYPWQCFLPCGLSFLYGNGGPMQTIGYMDGFLKVVGA